MAVNMLTTTPKLEDYLPLVEHQEQTPGTFFGGKPVLHFHSPDAKLSVYEDDVAVEDAPETLSWFQTTTSDSSHEGDSSDQITKTADVWITSRYIALFSPSENSGIKIEYQAVTFHAQDGDAVLLGLNLSDANTADEDIISFNFRISPGQVVKHETTGSGTGSSQANGNADPARALFDAVATCQELNPDRTDDDDEDFSGAFDETAPGATGWITSENMADFVGEDGEFRVPAGVTYFGGGDEEGGVGEVGVDGSSGASAGAVAGVTRTAAELDADDGEAVEEDTKWRRTD